MATLASVLNKYFARGAERGEIAARSIDVSNRLRSFANEDIYFYVKRIDNSSVVRESDPAAREACWKMIGTAVAAVALFVSVLMPSAYGLLAGYQIESLRQEGQRLTAERAELELNEASLLSPAHIQELARAQQFVDPAPEKVVYLDSRGDTELARASK
jgi:hypothetical protein